MVTLATFSCHAVINVVLEHRCWNKTGRTNFHFHHYFCYCVLSLWVVQIFSLSPLTFYSLVHSLHSVSSFFGLSYILSFYVLFCCFCIWPLPHLCLLVILHFKLSLLFYIYLLTLECCFLLGKKHIRMLSSDFVRISEVSPGQQRGGRRRDLSVYVWFMALCSVLQPEINKPNLCVVFVIISKLLGMYRKIKIHQKNTGELISLNTWCC